jgi:hypothetical protein
MKKHLCLFLAPCMIASSAWASLDIVSYEANLSQALETTTFAITFDKPLDLSTFDENGRAANQFQIFVYAGLGLEGRDAFASIIRTAEGPSTGNNVVVRAPVPLTDLEAQDPLSGGWGGIQAVAPITSQGNTISFTLNNKDFNLFGNDGFLYSINAFEYGAYASGSNAGLIFANVAKVSPGVTPIPEAGTGLQFLLGGALMVAALRRMKAPRAAAAA